MRQYVIDQLSREERANIESYLKRTLKPGPVDGLYWIEVPNLHCSCIAHASPAQRDFVLRFVDQMLEEEQIQA
jgi:hypothetical protein